MQGDRIRGSLFCNFGELYHTIINTNSHLWNYFTCLIYFEPGNLVTYSIHVLLDVVSRAWSRLILMRTYGKILYSQEIDKDWDHYSWLYKGITQIPQDIRATSSPFGQENHKTSPKKKCYVCSYLKPSYIVLQPFAHNLNFILYTTVNFFKIFSSLSVCVLKIFSILKKIHCKKIHKQHID